MKLLKEWWARFLISTVAVGALAEILSFTLGKELHPIVLITLLFGLYLGLSVLYGLHLRKKDRMD